MIYAGQIYYCEKFKFDDGGCSDKYFILLNTPVNAQVPYFACLTTTNIWQKPQSPGCHSNYGFYMIEEQKDWFPQKTWFELGRIREFSNKGFNESIVIKQFLLKGNLRKDTINALINCSLNCKDVDFTCSSMLKECRSCDPNLK